MGLFKPEITKTAVTYNPAEKRKLSDCYYDKKALDVLCWNNVQILEEDFGFSDKDFEVMVNNLEEIVTYIASKRNIKRTRHRKIGRVMRIAFFEYSDYLVNVCVDNSMYGNAEEKEQKIKDVLASEKCTNRAYLLSKFFNQYVQYAKTF